MNSLPFVVQIAIYIAAFAVIIRAGIFLIEVAIEVWPLLILIGILGAIVAGIWAII